MSGPSWYGNLKASAWVAPVGGLMTGLLMVIASMWVSDSWISEGRILPKRGKGQASGALAAAAVFGVQIPSPEDSTDTYVDIFHSHWMISRLLSKTYNYTTKGWAYGTPVAHLESIYGYLGTNNPDKASAALLRMLDIQRDMRTGLLALRVETESPDLSQQIVQSAFDNLEVYYGEKYRTQGSQKVVFINNRLELTKKTLVEAENKYLAFQLVNRNDRTSTDPVVRLRGERLEADRQIYRQVVNSLSMSLENALVEASDARPVINILDMASHPSSRSGPSRKNYFIGGAVAGFLVAIFWRNRNRINSLIQSGMAKYAIRE